MKDFLIQKTHYEIVKELIKNKGLFLKDDFDTFISRTEAACGKNPSYDSFVQSPSFQETAEILKSNNSHLVVIANVLYHLYSLYQQHERIYYVCPNLAINLAQTDLNIDTHFLKSPFPEIYIQIDPGLYYITDPQEPTKEHPVRGFYVNLREENETKYVRIMVAALKSNYADISASNDDAIFYFKLILGSGKIKEEVQKYFETSVENNKESLKKFGGLYNLKHMQDLFFFVFNTLLYITSKEPDIIKKLPVNYDAKIDQLKNKAKIRKIEQKKKKNTNLSVLIVGPNIASIYASEQIKKEGGISHWNLDKKIYVSGHWRTQWYGSEKDQTRKSEHIFIKPYEKGPELASVLNKKYKVQ
jgi:hypothetical protein